MDPSPYQRINCHFYDSLEAWATLRQQLWVKYRNENGQERELLSTISDLQTLRGAEYAYMANGRIIRLDHLLDIREIELI